MSPDPHPCRPGDRDLLRIVACGSVGDGKSTLIGRMICECGAVTLDQMATLERLSRRFGPADGGTDYALLLDGLAAEREQGGTVDVAYRFFSTPRRAFVVADAPGGERYTRNLVTGASNADLALLLVDVRHGVTRQTMRHGRLAKLLGVRGLVLVVNKMDLVGYDPEPYEAVRRSYEAFAASIGAGEVAAIPVSARHGDNVVAPSARMPWFAGPSVLTWLESVELGGDARAGALRFPVQSVVRADGGFRGCAGSVQSGAVAQGDTVVLARTGQECRVERIVTLDGDLEQAAGGRAVTLVLAQQVDVERGDVLAAPDAPPTMADQLAAHVVWFDEAPLLPGRRYVLKLASREVAATVTAIRHRIDPETGQKQAARTLEKNDIGFCNLTTTGAVALDPYAESRAGGAFILIDRYSGATAGAGLVRFALRRAGNLRHQDFNVDKARRSALKRHKPCIVWFTGLPAAGKSTIMNLVEQKLAERGVHTYALDGDNVRQGLNRDLGFTDADRVENIRRVGEVASLMVDAGLVTLCAFVSPFRAEREMVRELVRPDEFLEVFVDTPLAVCTARDPKGLYAKARAGQAIHVTGIDSPYEPPVAPDVHLETAHTSAERLADRVVNALMARGVLAR